MAILFKALHSVNAPSSTEVRLSGRVISVKELQPINASLPITVSPSFSVTCLKAEQEPNAP